MNCTTIDQSRKLVELGLDPDTADMCWTNHCYGRIRSSMRSANMTIDEYKKLLERFADSNSSDSYYPCWSLDALLEVMPVEFTLSREVIKGEVKHRLSYLFEDEPCETGFFEGDTYVDACVNGLMWLLKNGYIK